MSPTISVIVPVYNCEKYLNRCIDSILAQTFSNFELILIDDGSTDDSGVICDDYALKDERIIVIHQTNQGQAAARNNALQKSRGEWIHFVDSDDAIHPSILSYLYTAVLQHNANMSVCNYVESECMSNEFLQKYSFESYAVKCDENVLRKWLKEGDYYWLVWAKLIKKTIIEKYMFTVGRYFEDNAIVCKWIYEARRIAIVPHPLYFYQVNYAGTTKGKLDYKYFDFLWAMEQQINFYKSIGYFEILEDALLYYFGSFEDRYEKTKQMDKGYIFRFQIVSKAIRIWIKYSRPYKTVRQRWKNYIILAYPSLSLCLHKIKNGGREKNDS